MFNYSSCCLLCLADDVERLKDNCQTMMVIVVADDGNVQRTRALVKCFCLML